MLVHALITSIRTDPEPAILLVLDSLDEVLANLIGSGSRIALLAKHNLAQLLLIPVLHRICFLLLFLDLLRISGIGVEILLGRLALHTQVVAEFALPALLAVSLLVEETDHRLRIDTERYFLDLHGLE